MIEQCYNDIWPYFIIALPASSRNIVLQRHQYQLIAQIMITASLCENLIYVWVKWHVWNMCLYLVDQHAVVKIKPNRIRIRFNSLRAKFF